MRKSLHTDNLQIAIKRVDLLLQFLSLIFSQGETNMLTETQIDKLVSEFLNKIANEHEQMLSVAALPQHDWNENSPNNLIETYQSTLTDMRQSLKSNTFEPAGDFFSWIKNAKDTSWDELDRVKLGRNFLTGMIDYLENMFIPKLAGEYDTTIVSNAQQNTLLPVEKFEIKKEDQIGELIKAFYDEKVSSGYWKANTQTDVNAHIELFLEYFGKDTTIQQITKKHLREYRDKVLKRLPKRRKLNKVVRDNDAQCKC